MSKNAKNVSRKATRQAVSDAPFVRREIDRERTLSRRQARLLKLMRQAA